MAVTLTLQVGRNALVTSGGLTSLTRVHEYDLVYAGSGSPRRGRSTWCGVTPPPEPGPFSATAACRWRSAPFAYPLNVAVDVQFPVGRTPRACPTLGPSQTVGVFGFDPRATGTGISSVLAANPPTRAQG